MKPDLECGCQKGPRSSLLCEFKCTQCGSKDAGSCLQKICGRCSNDQGVCNICGKELTREEIINIIDSEVSCYKSSKGLDSDEDFKGFYQRK
jgi:hypothetical protein